MTTYQALYNRLTPANRYALEERCAIIEYEGGLDRAEAELKAVELWEMEIERKYNGKQTILSR